MTIAALITEGIGPGGSVKFLLTGGLGIGTAPVTSTATGGGYPLPRRSKRKPDWLEQKERDAALLAETIELYERVVEGKLPKPVAKAIAVAAAPYSSRPVVRKPPPVASIDFARMAAASGALDRLLAALARVEAAQSARLAVIAREAEAERHAMIEADDMDVIEQLLQMGIL